MGHIWPPQTEAVARAAADLAAAAGVESAAQDESICFQNAWLEANSALLALEGRDFQHQEAEIATALASARERLASFTNAVKRWELEAAPATAETPAAVAGA